MAKAPSAPYGGSSGQAVPPNPTQMAEIGVSGLRVFSGYLDEEFLKDLSGVRGRKKFREMSDNDPTVGAVLNAITLTLRSMEWETTPPDDMVGGNSGAQAEAEAEFVDSLFDDMTHTHGDFIAEVLTMLTFGWSYFEIVLKNRIGPYESDPSKRSKFTDGRIGIRKLAPRAQETLLRWEMQDDGGIAGLWQLSPVTGRLNYIPIERALLFRTTSRKNSPEGVSILRQAYVPWYYLKTIQPIEATGIERELAGLPVVSIPAKYLTSTAPADVAVRQAYEKVARDLKFNTQGGLLKPSDKWPDVDGNPTASDLVTIELLHSGGTRSIDTEAVKKGYQYDIARSALAEFVMLGSDSKGSFALSKDKTDFFLKAVEAFADIVEDVLNRHLIPRIWDANGLDRALMPSRRHGDLSGVDLGVLGAFLQATAAAGATWFPDDDLDASLRDAADLPPKSPETVKAQADEKQQAADQAAATAAAGNAVNKPAAGGPAGGADGVEKGWAEQPRDSIGRWTDGGGGAALGAVETTAAHGIARYQSGMDKIPRDAKEGGVDHYFGPRSSYIEINANLRDSKGNLGKINPRVRGYVENIDKAMSAANIQHGGEAVYRGMNVPSKSALAKLKSGSVINENGFMSTSLDKNEATTFVKGRLGKPGTKSMLMHITGKGGNVLYNHGESELLFNRGSKLTVTHTETGADGIIHVHARFGQ